jgi:hypothetical protein
MYIASAQTPHASAAALGLRLGGAVGAVDHGWTMSRIFASSQATKTA